MGIDRRRRCEVDDNATLRKSLDRSSDIDQQARFTGTDVPRNGTTSLDECIAAIATPEKTSCQEKYLTARPPEVGILEL